MFHAIFLAGLVLIGAVGGKAFLTALASQPVIGSVAAWYIGYVGPLSDGVTANLVYGAMSLQILYMVLTPILYGPALARKAVMWFRTRHMGAQH